MTLTEFRELYPDAQPVPNNGPNYRSEVIYLPLSTTRNLQASRDIFRLSSHVVSTRACDTFYLVPRVGN